MKKRLILSRFLLLMFVFSLAQMLKQGFDLATAALDD